MSSPATPHPRRLVAAPHVPPLLVLALAGAAVTAALGARVSDGDHALHVDRAATKAVDGLFPVQHGDGGVVADVVARLGSPVPVAVLLVVLAAAALRWRGRRALALSVLGPLAAMATTSLVLKPLIARTRGVELAYPSGHTTAVASLAVTVAVLVLSSRMRRARRWAVAAALAGLVAAVAVALIGRGVHFPTDVVGGLGVAVAVVPTVATALDALAGSVTARRAEAGRAG
jgi:membrane-associated phospholipid phosphatase